MANPIVIIKNTTGSIITIKDLSGISVNSSSQLTLTDIFHFYNIASSIGLKTYVSSGDIIINDGSSDLNIANGLEHITIKSSYTTTQEVIGLVNTSLAGIRKCRLSLGSNSQNYSESNGSSWTSSRLFIFEGTSIWTPSYVKIIVSRSGSSGTSYFKLIDYSHNSNIIAECTWTESYIIIKNINSLTNLPSSESIFEIQVKGYVEGGMHGGTHTARIHYFEMF